MTTFTTEDREKAEKDLLILFPDGIEKTIKTVLENEELNYPIPFFGWLNENL